VNVLEENPSMVVSKEIFDKLIITQIALFKQIEAKQHIEGAIITQEEADFCNVFMEYASELNRVIREQL
jgi:hypothetical protein